MAHTPDQPPDPPGAASTAAAGPAARFQRWARMTGDPVLTLLGMTLVALLVYTLTSAQSRMDRLEDTMAAGFAAVDENFEKLETKLTEQTDAKIDELDTKFEARFEQLEARIDKIDARTEQLDAKIDAVDAKIDARIDAVDLKLTALIAALGKAAEVQTATEGGLEGS